MITRVRMSRTVVVFYFRWNLPADVTGDAGGAGLVPGPAGDNPDPPVRVRHGQQQGRRRGAALGNQSQKTNKSNIYHLDFMSRENKFVRMLNVDHKKSMIKVHQRFHVWSLTPVVMFDFLLMSVSNGVIKNFHLSGNWQTDKIDLHQSIIK